MECVPRNDAELRRERLIGRCGALYPGPPPSAWATAGRSGAWVRRAKR